VVTVLTDIKKKISNESGSALILVLLLVVVFGIIGSSLIYISLIHHENTIKRELQQQAYYAAETGMIDAIKKIQTNPSRTLSENISTNLSPTIKYSVIKDDFIKGKNASLGIDTNTGIKLISSGEAKISDELKSNVTITTILDKNRPLVFDDISFFDYSLFSNNDLYLGQEKLTFNDWSASWNSPFMKLSVYDNEDAVLKNKIDSVGNIYSDSSIHLYYSDQVRAKKSCRPFDFFCYMSSFFDAFFTSYTSPESYFDVGYPEQVLGMRPTLMDGTLRSSADSYKSGYNLFDKDTAQEYVVDDYTREYRDPTNNLLTNSILGEYDPNLKYEVDDEGNFTDIFDDLTTKITNISSTYGMNENIGDLHITNDEISKSQLKGWIHVTGNLIIDEGVEIKNLSNLLILVDGGIIIGAKQPTSTVESDLPVKLKGNNLILISKGIETSNWKNTLRDLSPIKNLSTTYSLFFSTITEYTTQSFMNKYIDYHSNLSIVINENSEIDGWLIGKKDVVMDYKLINSTDIGSNPPTVKISGGVIGRKILFPKSIEIAKDLYIYDWDVQYN